jgi:choline dehydrogenase-like flavoprotein
MPAKEVDVVVVGSGAGGSPVALEMARAGASVIVLEKGPRYSRKDFLQDEIVSSRRDFFVPYPQNDPHRLKRPGNEPVSSTNFGWTSQCVGGGTVHMSGFFFRAHPKDFALQKNYGRIEGTTAIDWPFGYETLAPYYDKVEQEIGVSGNVDNNPFEPPRKGPFPYDPVLTHPISAWIDELGKKIGVHPFAVPRAILTRPKGDRMGCVYHNVCGSYGCEVGAKGSTLHALLPEAESTGRCQIIPDAMVRQVVMQKNGRARGVTYLDAKGQEHEVRARVVIVAASAIESSRLLLLSACGRHPRGLGNNGGQVGKNLCFSTLGQLYGHLHYEDFASEQRDVLKNQLPFVGRAVQDYYEVPRQGDIFGKGGTFHFLWEHDNPVHRATQAAKPPGQPHIAYGEVLMKRLHERFTQSRALEVECFGEWLPTEGCHVSLDDEVTDRFGLPAALITLARHPSDYASSALLVGKARQMLEALGCRDVTTVAVGGETSVLQNGTCRMGTDPATSVTTPSGHLHEVDNVFVTCGGSLPSSSSVPTTMTIMANSFRIADRIKNQFAHRA